MKTIKNKPQTKNFQDYDYLDKLNEDELVFLNKFNNEYYNGRFDHDEPVMLDTKIIKKEYLKIKKDKVAYEQFMKELKIINNKKDNTYPKFVEKSYNLFCELLKLQKNEDENLDEKLIAYNRYTQQKNTIPLSIEDYVKPSRKQFYKHLTSFDFIKHKIRNKYNSELYYKKQDIMNRDTNANRNVVQYNDSNKKKMNNDYYTDMDKIVDLGGLIYDPENINYETENVADALILKSEEIIDICKYSKITQIQPIIKNYFNHIDDFNTKLDKIMILYLTIKAICNFLDTDCEEYNECNRIYKVYNNIFKIKFNGKNLKGFNFDIPDFLKE